MINLETRYETFTVFKGRKAQVSYPKDKPGYIIRFIANAIPSTKDLAFFDKMDIYNKNGTEDGYVVKYCGPKEIFIGWYHKRLVRSGRKFYSRSNWDYAIRYDGRRLITTKATFYDNMSMVSFIVSYFGVECILDDLSQLGKSRLFGSKTVLKGIFAQKISNQKEALSVWFKAVAKAKVQRYETLKTFINTWDQYEYDDSIMDFLEFTTSFDASVRLIATGDRDKSAVFHDLMKDCMMLDKKANPNWSLSRMEQEHLANTEQIMLQNKHALSDEDIYNNLPSQVRSKKLQGEFLTTERKVFTEATTMHHCLYNHYYKKIADKTYLALSITYPERCTVGLETKKEGDKTLVKIDQIRAKRNRITKDETQELIKAFVNDNQNHLLVFFRTKPVAAPVTQEMMEDLPF